MDPEFFPAEVQREALLHLSKSKLSEDQQAAFLAYASEMAQMISLDEITTGKANRQQIANVEAAAHALVNALGALKRPAMAAMQAHSAYLACVTSPPVNLPESVLQAIAPRGRGELLDMGWDWAHALQEAAGYASGNFELGKGSKPELLRARGYVAMLADRIKRMTGKSPPKDAASWFADVVGCLGKHMGLSIGARVVASGVKTIR